jgi:hypothetical protein
LGVAFGRSDNGYSGKPFSVLVHVGAQYHGVDGGIYSDTYQGSKMILDRYLARQYLPMFVASIGMFMFLLVIIDLFTNLVRYLNYEIPFAQKRARAPRASDNRRTQTAAIEAPVPVPVPVIEELPLPPEDGEAEIPLPPVEGEELLPPPDEPEEEVTPAEDEEGMRD